MKNKLFKSISALALCLAILVTIIPADQLCDCSNELPPHTKTECPFLIDPQDDPNPPREED